MVVAPGTPIVGRVVWVAHNGMRARIIPIYNNLGGGWKDADPQHYPKRSQIIWWKPLLDVKAGSVVLFSAADNDGGDDEIQARDAQYLNPVIEFPEMGYAAAVDRLASGRFPVGTEIRAGKDIFAWCAGDILLGPLTPEITGSTFSVPRASLNRVPYRENETAIFYPPGGEIFCAPTSPETGSFDCRPDSAVLRKAIEDAVAAARESSAPVPEFLATRTLMRSAADKLGDGESLGDRQYKRDRLKRALTICDDTDEVRRYSSELATVLLESPVVQNDLKRHKAARFAGLMAAAEDEVQEKLKEEHGKLAQLAEETYALQKEKFKHSAELEQLRVELGETEATVSRQLEALEKVVLGRVDGLVDDASSFLADSVLLRALGAGTSATTSSISNAVGPAQEWSPAWRAVASVEALPLDDALRAASRDFGMDQLVLRRIHAAVSAGLIPVLTGNGGSVALTAYATAVCAGRIAALPVAHDFLHPVDLLGIRAAAPATTRMHAGLLSGASAAVHADGMGLLVLEAFNRAPTESYLLPWLQSHDRGIAVPATAQRIVGSERVVPHRDLLVAATAAAGHTTAPVSPDLWGFAVAIDVPRSPGRVVSATAPTAVSESRSAPTGAVDTTIESLERAVGGYWPIDGGVLDTARRFAAALNAPGESDVVLAALVECVLVPALSTSLRDRDLEVAVNATLDWSRTTEPTRRQQVQSLAQRLHRRFA